MRKNILRLAVGVPVTAIAFALTLYLFRSLFGATDLFTLLAGAGVALFAGVMAGAWLTPRWSAVTACVLAGSIVVGVLAFGIPWGLSASPDIFVVKNPAYFRTIGTFTYWGSEENQPIENVWVAFACPNVENDASMLGAHPAGVSLFHVAQDNTLIPEVYIWRQGITENWTTLSLAMYGGRSEPLRIKGWGVGPTLWGDAICCQLDRIYPREAVNVIVEHVGEVDETRGLTIRIYGIEENRSNCAFIYSENFPITVSMRLQLQRWIDNAWVPVETYSRYVDNITSTGLWLYPAPHESLKWFYPALHESPFTGG